MEIIQYEEEREKKIGKKNEQSLQDLWDNTKRSYIHVIEVSEKEEEKNGAEKIFEELMAENFPNLVKDIHFQIQET